jgi:hypothetical protein
VTRDQIVNGSVSARRQGSAWFTTTSQQSGVGHRGLRLHHDREVALRSGLGLLAALTAMVGLAAPAAAHGGAAFDHVGTFNVPDNLRSAEPGSTVTSAEIVAAGPGGRSLV